MARIIIATSDPWNISQKLKEDDWETALDEFKTNLGLDHVKNLIVNHYDLLRIPISYINGLKNLLDKKEINGDTFETKIKAILQNDFLFNPIIKKKQTNKFNATFQSKNRTMPSTYFWINHIFNKEIGDEIKEVGKTIELSLDGKYIRYSNLLEPLVTQLGAIRQDFRGNRIIILNLFDKDLQSKKSKDIYSKFHSLSVKIDDIRLEFVNDKNPKISQLKDYIALLNKYMKNLDDFVDYIQSLHPSIELEIEEELQTKKDSRENREIRRFKMDQQLYNRIKNKSKAN